MVKMNEKLKRLYNECIEELKTIKINILDVSKFGTIDINISKRNVRRYGCCKQEKPDENYYLMIKRGKKIIKQYYVFKVHHIEISKWVMQLDENIIKNTIMHEIIHCFPNCNNHGIEFKKYATYINQKLGYNITRLGNKEDDFKKSNLEYTGKEIKYNYKIICTKCGQVIYRQRLKSRFIDNYRCGKCGGSLKLTKCNSL